MTITITVRKIHLAVAVAAIVLLVPATAALADHVFVDVPDAKFYADPVKWADDNHITTGSPAGSDTFKPEDPVTRGESVTFLERYHDNLATPAIAANTSDIGDNAADIAALDTAMPFVVTAVKTDEIPLTDTPAAYVTVSVTAPVDGHVTVNSTAAVGHDGGNGSIVTCVIAESTDIPAFITTSAVSLQWFEKQNASNEGSVSGTRTFEIAGASTVDYVLACEEAPDGGKIFARNLTAIFTPAP